MGRRGGGLRARPYRKRGERSAPFEPEESRALRERLKHARGSLTGKLEEEYLAEQRLRWSIEQQATQQKGR